MKFKILGLGAALLMCTISWAQNRHFINAVGQSYSPDSIYGGIGDSIIFQVGPMHPTVQVTKTTWDNDGVTAKPGGFEYLDGQARFRIDVPGDIYYVCKNHVLDGMKGQIIVRTVSIEEEELRNSIKLYPVPAVDRINLEWSKELDIQSVEIADLSGKTLENLPIGEISNKKLLEFNISHLPAGSYLLIIESLEASTSLRFSIEN